ncbi:CinA family protein [Flindersiella endophytica]
MNLPDAGRRAVAERCRQLLAAHRETVATAESLTGGLLGAALTSVAGASSVYRGGVVAYAVELKVSLLGVPAEQLAANGPVHPDTALAMASGAAERLGATYGLATTGVAGPEPHGAQPVGTVFIACADRVRELRLSGDRDQIREGTVDAALELLQEVLADTHGAVSA